MFVGLGVTLVWIGGIVAIVGGILRADGVGVGVGAALLGIGLILAAIADMLAERQGDRGGERA